MLPHSVTLLCALGTAIFGTAVSGWVGIIAFAGGFAGAVRWLVPEPAWLATGVALMAAACLADSRVKPLAAVMAGLLAGTWASLLVETGLPLIAALSVTIGPAVVSAWFTASRREFAPAAIRDEALAILGVGGVLVAIAPDVLAGWRSAAVLNIEPGAGARGVGAVHEWVWAVTGLAAVAGGAHAVRRRR